MAAMNINMAINLSRCTDELKLGVVVAECNRQHVLRELTELKILCDTVLIAAVVSHDILV